MIYYELYYMGSILAEWDSVDDAYEDMKSDYRDCGPEAFKFSTFVKVENEKRTVIARDHDIIRYFQNRLEI